LRDGYPRFQAKGYEILGVSPDSVKKHVKFQDKYNLPIPFCWQMKTTLWPRHTGFGGEKEIYGPGLHGHYAHHLRD
jgi:peroxiredoxin Q/BCP